MTKVAAEVVCLDFPRGKERCRFTDCARPLGDRLNLAAEVSCLAAKNSFANKWIDQTVKVVEIGGVQSGGYL